MNRVAACVLKLVLDKKNAMVLRYFYGMKNPFQPGDQKEFTKVVDATEIASFESGTVHTVYSTFALARDAEWSGRLFVLEMKGDDEEGIGTRITVEHKSPAFIGQEIRFIATFDEISESREIMTSYQAFCGERLIAQGIQGQKILPKQKLETIFSSLEGKE